MIDLSATNESCCEHTIRAWTGECTDEGVGLIVLVEVWDPSGRPVCRFEEFLDAAVQRGDALWPDEKREAALRLQERALARARDAVLVESLADLNGHRYDIVAETARLQP